MVVVRAPPSVSKIITDGSDTQGRRPWTKEKKRSNGEKRGAKIKEKEREERVGEKSEECACERSEEQKSRT